MARHPQVPDCMYVLIDGLPSSLAEAMAQTAARTARSRTPKLTGQSARGMRAYYGLGFFGVRWDSNDPQVWYQERGTRPRTMRELAGKVIPMWVDDPTGQVKRENPKSETRVTASGRRQVKIFRKAARIGATKTVRRRILGQDLPVTVPASYPGAPGRIATRSLSGQVSRGNSGVRWRHPGLEARGFIRDSIITVAEAAGYGVPEVHSISHRA